MATYTTRLRPTGNSISFSSILHRIRPHLQVQQGAFISLLIVLALIAFEIFNYSTTEFTLTDLIGDLQFANLRWATILALAFAGMDFAGIARLFTPQRGTKPALDVWYLLGAWLLAATMNAILTWWAISLALLRHSGLGNEIVGREALLTSVPVFVAILVWLIRILLIGSFTLSGSARSKTRTASRSSSKSASDPSEPRHLHADSPKSAFTNQRPITPNPKPRRA